MTKEPQLQREKHELLNAPLKPIEPNMSTRTRYILFAIPGLVVGWCCSWQNLCFYLSGCVFMYLAARFL